MDVAAVRALPSTAVAVVSMNPLGGSEELPDGSRKTTSGGVVGFYSLEMSAEQLATRLIADHTGIPGYMIRQGTIDATQYEEIRDACLEIQGLPLYIDDTGGLPISALAARARRLKRTHGLDLIVVDYLQLVTSSRARAGASRVEEVSEVTQNLKALAKELGVPVIALTNLEADLGEFFTDPIVLAERQKALAIPVLVESRVEAQISAWTRSYSGKVTECVIFRFPNYFCALRVAGLIFFGKGITSTV